MQISPISSKSMFMNYQANSPCTNESVYKKHWILEDATAQVTCGLSLLI